MARPTTRKGTANAVFRKRIPADVRRILDALPAAYRPNGWGKDEIVLTLGTADRRKAAAEHARIAAEVEGRFTALRGGVRRLTKRDAVALSGLIYRALSGAVEDDPGSNPAAWVQIVNDTETAGEGRFGFGQLVIGDHALARELDLEARFGGMADAQLARNGLIVDRESRALLIEELARALDDAALNLSRKAGGNYRPDPAAERFPEWKPDERATAFPDGKSLTLLTLFDRWADHPEQEPQARRTKGRYRSVFNAVATFLNDPDARKVTTDDLQRYVEARMADEGRGRLLPKVARDVHKAALSSVYGWAARKRIVPTNPAEGISIKVAKVRKVRKLEATDAETVALVNAALAIPETALAQTLDAAKRWATLITLYTGCRIGEATQLRREDVDTGDSAFPMIRITPEAGDVKDKEVRLVPVHPRLVELGLLSFVQAAAPGPLFYGSQKRRNAKAKTPEYELAARAIAAWSRENGLEDPNIKRPMHSLRHRFVALARNANMEGQYMKAITGHEPGDESERYGSFSPKTLHREIVRLRPEIVEGRGGSEVAEFRPGSNWTAHHP